MNVTNRRRAFSAALYLALGAGAAQAADITVTPGAVDDDPGLMFDVPADAVSGETFARFRLDSAGGLTPDGVAADGEVEDYLIVFTRMPVETDLSVTVDDAPDPVTVGGNVTYTVTVTNNGSASATDVVVGTTLPSGASFVSAEIGGAQCAESAGEVECALGELEADGSREAVVVARAEQAGSLAFTVTVTAAEADPAPANNTASETTTASAGGGGSGGGGGGSGGGGGAADPWLLGLLGLALIASRRLVEVTDNALTRKKRTTGETRMNRTNHRRALPAALCLALGAEVAQTA